jgi:ribosomal protein L4
MKSTVDWAESSYKLKFGYLMGHPRVGKNSHACAHFVSGRVWVAPIGKKYTRTYTRRVPDTRTRIAIPSMSSIGAHFSTPD